METDRLDVVIFGATGFTGKHVVKEAARLAKEKEFKFGVAGRRKQELENVVKSYAPDIDVPVIIADIKNEESLKKMAEKAKVIANCCGPYRFYGEAVVKACIEAKTHHIDVTGETQFIEEMQLKYNKAAEDAGIYIISACGFDSIPCDLGVVFTQEKFDGSINSIEAYYNMGTTGKTSGSVANYTTLESFLYSIANINSIQKIRKELYPEKLPSFQPKLKSRGLLPHRSAFSDGWSTIFPGCDRSIVYRTQRYFFERYKQRPIQFHVYITFKSFFEVLAIMFMGVLFFFMTRFSCGCNLILKYPGLFTLGFISHEPPTEETLNNTHYSITFLARGWKEKLSEPTDVHSEPPNKEMVTKVTGANAYNITAISLMLSALTIIKESDKMPKGGGVLSSGAAFSKTSLINELNKNCLTFEVVSSIEN